MIYKWIIQQQKTSVLISNISVLSNFITAFVQKYIQPFPNQVQVTFPTWVVLLVLEKI